MPLQTKTNNNTEGHWRAWLYEDDYIAARSAEEASEWVSYEFGETIDPDWWEEVDDSKRLTFWEGEPGKNEQTKTALEWAKETSVREDGPGLIASEDV